MVARAVGAAARAASSGARRRRMRSSRLTPLDAGVPPDAETARNEGGGDARFSNSSPPAPLDAPRRSRALALIHGALALAPPAYVPPPPPPPDHAFESGAAPSDPSAGPRRSRSEPVDGKLRRSSSYDDRSALVGLGVRRTMSSNLSCTCCAS